MKPHPLLLSALAAALLAPAAAKPSGGGVSKPSFPSSPSASKPSFPSSPSASKPSFPVPTSASPPTLGKRPAVKTPAGPISATTRSPYNPSPAYKPLSSTGAPTVRSGGGGFSSTAKRIAKAAAVGAAVAFVVVAAGSFLYGGRHSSPYCRGSDQDRYASGNCPRGTSSQKHQCTSEIPLCPIPPLVKSKWALGSKAPPNVDVLFDKSVCSVVALPALPAADNATAVDATAASAAESAETPPAADDASAATAPDGTNATEDGGAARRLAVEGESGLDACVRRILAAGGCADHTPTNQFQYDEDSGTCGCCSSIQVTTLDVDNFASAVYGYRDATINSAPDYCISGSTMFYPDAAGGPDVAHACQCGGCSTCGAGNGRYMDWSGPFVIPDSVGAVSFADAAKTVPLYDPVDTCLCDDFSPSQCELDALQTSVGASVGVFASNLVVGLSALVALVGFVRRG